MRTVRTIMEKMDPDEGDDSGDVVREADRTVYYKLTAKQALELLRKAIKVMGAVNLLGSDVEYLPISKSSIVVHLKGARMSGNILSAGHSWELMANGTLFIG
jgi:hypothetical protein